MDQPMLPPGNTKPTSKRSRKSRSTSAHAKPLSLGFIAVLCAAAYFLEFILLVVFLPRLRQYGSDVVTFGAYCTLGLISALILFGFLKSTGTLSGKVFGIPVKFGGAAALFVLVLVGGLRYESWSRSSGDFSVPIYFFVEGQPEAPINGKLILYLDEPKIASIEAGYCSPQRIPPKWNGVSVRCSAEVDGFTIDGSDPHVLLTPGEQQRVKLRPTQAKQNLSVSMRYDIRTTDGFPFGWMYSRENPQGVTAAPVSMGQMHAQLKVTDEGFDDRTIGGLDGAPVASYLVLLTNLAKHPVSITSTDLVVRERKALPPRSVWIWNRKGRVKNEVTEASLTAKTTRIKIYPKNDEIAQLVEQDVLPLRLNLLNVEDGVYTLGIRADGQDNGASFVAESGTEILASPKDRATSAESLHILSNAADPELGRALVNLTPDQFSQAAAKFNNQLPKADEVRAFLKENFGVKLSTTDAIDGLLTQVLSASESGLGYLIETKGAAESLPLISKFLKTFPTSDKVQFLEIICLREKGDMEAAKSKCAELIKGDPTSSWGYYARWMIEGELRDLEAALRLTPDQPDFLGESIEHSVVRKAGPITAFLKRSFQRLDEETQRQIVVSLLFRILRHDYALAAGPQCAQRLAEFSPPFSAVMALMPEAGFWGMTKGSGGKAVSGEIQNSVFDLLIKLGRFRLALGYSKIWNRQDLIERALWNSYDFASLHDIYRIESFVPNNADSYIFACLAALDREDFPLFDKLVRENRNSFHNQTNLVHFHYNVIKGNFEAARQQMGYYLLQSDPFNPRKDGSVMGNIERTFLKSFAGSEWAMRAAEQVNQATKPYSAIPRFWHLCFGRNDNPLTEWPAEFTIQNRKGGRQTVWVVLATLQQIGGEIEKLDIVRMPFETCLLFDGKISDSSPTHHGRTVKECQDTIPDGRLFFDRGVYGKKLTLSQIEASRQYSVALYYYWNCGNAVEALSNVEQALRNDPDFYEALILKAASSACLGDSKEFERIGRKVGAMNLPWPKFSSL